MKLSSTGLPKPHIRPGKSWPFLCVGAGTYGYGKTREEAYEAWKLARAINNRKRSPDYNHIPTAHHLNQKGGETSWPWQS